MIKQLNTYLQEVFIKLVCSGIGHNEGVAINVLSVEEWVRLKAFADEQGLSAIVLDGIEMLPDNQRPPQVMLLGWIGEVMQEYEYRYDAYTKAMSKLAAFYRQHDYKMMVLKGYACSLDWPKPYHRPCGDIDVWLFGQQRGADAALVASFRFHDPSFKIDSSHHHHTVFEWDGFMVENHYDFVNVHARKSSAEMERIFKELGSELHLNLDHNENLGIKKGGRIMRVSVGGETVYLPSANLHALFLIKHMVSHFAASEISLRQVLDWAFFVEKHTEKIDWEWLNEMIERFHMKDFVNCINAICVEDLGFPVDIFPEVQLVSELKDRVLNDILFPAFGTAGPRGLIARWAYKYKRWLGNAWKQRMCYPESRWESFWTLLRSHIIKPEV